MWTIDHDDGSQYFNDTENFMVFGESIDAAVRGTIVLTKTFNCDRGLQKLLGKSQIV